MGTPKWDGYRVVLHVVRDDDDVTHCRVQSRRGTDLTGSFPDIAAAACRQLPAGTVLDGEAVVWSGERLDFAALQLRLGGGPRAARQAREQPASFVAFDVLAHGGVAWLDRPLRERRQQLEGLLPALSPPLHVSPATCDRDMAATWLEQYREAHVGIEGLVVKGLGSRTVLAGGAGSSCAAGPPPKRSSARSPARSPGRSAWCWACTTAAC